MLNGVVTTVGPADPKAGREFPKAAVDPRPWPLVVVMLAAVLGVFFALRAHLNEPAAREGGARGPAGPAGPAGAIGAAAVVVPALPEAKEALEQGVTLTFKQGDKVDVRAARVMSLYVPAGQAASPFLAPGPFEATWSGFLNLRLRGEFTFSVLGRGKVAVKVAGKTVVEASGDDFGGKASEVVSLAKGKNAIEVVYAAPAKGDAWVRVLWASREFPPEPVQPTVLSHDVSAKGLREASRVREGRELWATLRCGNCHENPAGGAAAMPELSADAPNLANAGARLTQQWMAAWIAEPKKWRADASMPKVFHGESPAEAADVAAYLATLGKPSGEAAKEFEDEAVAEGGQLFAALGCIGCHTKPDAEEADKEGMRVPLNLVGVKFQPGGLRAWLMNPQEHYQWTRMPNFHLSDVEADRLVAYLSKKAAAKWEDAEAKGDAGKGKALFASVGCVNCHSVSADGAGRAPQFDGAHRGQARRLKADSLEVLVSKSKWDRGCVATDDAARGKAPVYGLSEGQRAALMAFAAGGVASLNNDVVTEFAARQVRQSQCTSCHARDEVEDRWSGLAEEVADLMPPEGNIEGDNPADAGDADPNAPRKAKLFHPRGLGKLHGGDEIVISGDQARPALTWVGERLRPEYMAKIVAGELPYKPRYWIRSRMPGFPARAKELAAGLAMEHGFPPVGEKRAEAKANAAEIGRKLIGRDGGFACVTCHSVADSKAISPFEAPAPNFLHVAERMTHDHYMRWMRKPMRFQPGTKMPQFSEDGKSTLKEVLDGDADKQFEAVWQYFLLGEKMTPPE